MASNEVNFDIVTIDAPGCWKVWRVGR